MSCEFPPGYACPDDAGTLTDPHWSGNSCGFVFLWQVGVQEAKNVQNFVPRSQ